MNPFLVILPTYNEAQNIERLVYDILNTGLPLDILILDDGSPDGTGAVADRLARELPRVMVLHRPHRMGLGTAYREAFGYALEAGYQFAVQMDADFSHHPRYLPQLCGRALYHDVVIGSRYVQGGGVSGWPWYRRLLSRIGNWYARTLLGLPYRDVTSGYKVLSRVALEHICSSNLISLGYAVQIEINCVAHRAGTSIEEVPIVFSERARGESKLTLAIIYEGIINSIILRKLVK